MEGAAAALLVCPFRPRLKGPSLPAFAARNIFGGSLAQAKRALRCRFANCPPALAKPCWLYERLGQRRPHGLDIVGYLLSEIGLGEAARLMVAALDHGGVSTGLVNVPLAGRMSELALAERLAGAPRHDTSLTICGAAEIGMFAPRNCRGQWNIAYPYWELPRLPAIWKSQFDAFDAYWAPTTFIREALEELLSRRVPLVPQPVYLPTRPPQQSFVGPLTIHTFFDFDSYVARKNPLGAIRAFRAAFPTGREDVRLVVKARGHPDEQARRHLFACAQNDPRIEIIDRTLSRAEMSSLMDACHVFISLHRSEGFGLGCAEALARGKCVVATDFGGSRDFVNERTGYPVAYRAVAVNEGQYVGVEGGSSWAEPNIDHAASLLRQIHDAPDSAADRARAGFFHLKSTHSFEATSHIIKQLL